MTGRVEVKYIRGEVTFCTLLFSGTKMLGTKMGYALLVLGGEMNKGKEMIRCRFQ